MIVCIGFIVALVAVTWFLNDSSIPDDVVNTNYQKGNHKRKRMIKYMAVHLIVDQPTVFIVESLVRIIYATSVEELKRMK